MNGKKGRKPSLPCVNRLAVAADSGSSSARRAGADLESKKRKKLVAIHQALNDDPVDVETLRQSAVSEGGLLTDEIRRKVWPKLLNVNVYNLPLKPGKDIREGHKDYSQVLMDVQRSLRRFPHGMRPEQRGVLQEQLINVILYILQGNLQLHYYQGYHDIVVTFLLVVGERMAIALMEILSAHHLRDFMDPTMDSTKHILNYLMPILERVKPELHDFMQRILPMAQLPVTAAEIEEILSLLHFTSSRFFNLGTMETCPEQTICRSLATLNFVNNNRRAEVGTIFALSWLITWYGHVLSEFRHAVRLYDFFLASHPLMPVYFAAAIVLYREKEVLKCDCDMASVHQLLSKIPQDLPYEVLIIKAEELFSHYPPLELAKQAALQLRKSIAISTFQDFQVATSQQRPDAVLRKQFREKPRPIPTNTLAVPLAGANQLVKMAVWGLTATLGAAAFAVVNTAVEWAPEFVLQLFP